MEKQRPFPKVSPESNDSYIFTESKAASPRNVLGLIKGCFEKKSFRVGIRSLESWAHLSSSGESDFFSNITSFIYRREKTIPSEFNEWGGFSYYLVNYLDANNYIKKEDVFAFSGVDNYGAIIKKNDLKEVLYKFFGNNYLIENLTDKNIGFEYIESSDSYRIYLQGGDTAFQSTVSKLIKAEKDENNIYLYEKIAVVVPGEDLYYTNYLDNKKVGKTLNGKDIWEYEEDLGYPTNYKVVLVKKDEKLQIVKASE